jgi:hypothetical protein
MPNLGDQSTCTRCKTSIVYDMRFDDSPWKHIDTDKYSCFFTPGYEFCTDYDYGTVEPNPKYGSIGNRVAGTLTMPGAAQETLPKPKRASKPRKTRVKRVPKYVKPIIGRRFRTE